MSNTGIRVGSQGTTTTALELAIGISESDFSNRSVTLIGFGNMGKHYIQALQSLGVGEVNVCSRSQSPLNALSSIRNIRTVSGGYQALTVEPGPDDLAIVASPTADLAPASKHLADLGFKKILIEKPVALRSTEIGDLDNHLSNMGTEAFCAYNRIAYPTLVEARSRTENEGGITSCTYSVTEILSDDMEKNHTTDELSHWGVANSLHPISMAHALIGQPMTWDGRRAGNLAWHPSGSVFVGSGFSERDVPFAYHGDWGSKGRWSVEFNTQVSSYRLCPLEKLFTKRSSLSDWEEVPVAVYDSAIKSGVVEQLAASMDTNIDRMVSLMDLKQTVKLTEFAEGVFGYSVS